jgi:hypothetical protein
MASVRLLVGLLQDGLSKKKSTACATNLLNMNTYVSAAKQRVVKHMTNE